MFFREKTRKLPQFIEIQTTILCYNKINQFFEYLIQNKIKKGENQKNGEIR